MSAASPAPDAGAGMTAAELGRVLRRRAWLVVGLPVVVAVLSLATAKPPPAQYQARLAFAVDIPHSAIVIGSDEGSPAKIGEALIDDISRIIGRDQFAAAVARRLPPSLHVTAGELASETSATDRHRVSDVTVTRTLAPGQDPAALQQELTTVAQAVVAELNENGAAWFARLGDDQVKLTIVDAPDVTQLPPTLRQRLDVPLRVLLALVLAVGVALLLHALDPRLYGDAEARLAAGAPVVGWLPARRRRWR
jgi:capsular polysaccharide biosynthesis protein